ncbi:uncharacterized protein [Physcomitrium patens]|uniref:Uncharacterized protein n=1 Tax=Physcomitrium patens TaxID=3218 RepID=A0A2K1KBZ4_PHYPA|nr:hypothetical protein PHYPA_010490 [Physcomitrium patens]
MPSPGCLEVNERKRGGNNVEAWNLEGRAKGLFTGTGLALCYKTGLSTLVPGILLPAAQLHTEHLSPPLRGLPQCLAVDDLSGVICGFCSSARSGNSIFLSPRHAS